MKTYMLILISFLFIATASNAQSTSYLEDSDVLYTVRSDQYSQERCRLDLHLPKDTKDFVTVIWFHGGGLTGGEKDIPKGLKNKGIGVISASYRFAPQASVEEILRDASAAVKWTYAHIEEYGGNKNKIVIAGYSAGAYLALMLGLDKSYLSSVDIDADNFLGIIALSGQTITHFTARQQLGMLETQPLVDRLAPLYWVRKDAIPITLITGDRELEMLGRYEENAYLKRMLNIVGHKEVKLLELDGYNHGMTEPGYPLLLKQVKSWSARQ